jgi:hypothetical protein
MTLKEALHQVKDMKDYLTDAERAEHLCLLVGTTVDEYVKAYEDALITIWKQAGKCWDGNRECSDPQAVAERVIKKVHPRLHKKLDNLPYQEVKVYKNGKVKY